MHVPCKIHCGLVLKGLLTHKWKFAEHKLRCFLKMWVTNPFLVPTDPTNYFSLKWKSMGTSSYLVSNILQGVFFYVQPKRKKLMPVWSSVRLSKWWQNFHLWVNYRFNVGLRSFLELENYGPQYILKYSEAEIFFKHLPFRSPEWQESTWIWRHQNNNCFQ